MLLLKGEMLGFSGDKRLMAPLLTEVAALITRINELRKNLPTTTAQKVNDLINDIEALTKKHIDLLDICNRKIVFAIKTVIIKFAQPQF